MSELETVTGEVVWVDGSLEADERIIERGLGSFVEVGCALKHIRDERLYIQAGFDTFDDYCRRRWDMASRTAHQQIAASRVVEVCAIAHTTPEWTVRPLVKVLNEHGEKAAVEAWTQIVERHDGDGPVTGREVSRFFTHGSSYGKPNWHELLGQIGDTLLKAQKEFERFEAEIGDRPPAEALREKAGRYAEWADGLAEALRKVEAA